MKRWSFLSCQFPLGRYEHPSLLIWFYPRFLQEYWGLAPVDSSNVRMRCRVLLSCRYCSGLNNMFVTKEKLDDVPFVAGQIWAAHVSYNIVVFIVMILLRMSSNWLFTFDPVAPRNNSSPIYFLSTFITGLLFLLYSNPKQILQWKFIMW